ncbi:pepsin/retropepsin-like aspartic protease family protein [Aurantiacibacter hainanensis]|uniref:pepsin/retropepsin-like aspartic protease family protein n=1 Tax=Aurantiacibacter hainanensis TaxID=3076114 RepID=UPI0030C75FE8
MKWLTLALLLTCTALPAQAEELIVEGDRLFLPASVDGVRTRALLDSGAEVTVFNSAFAESIGIGAGEEVTARGTGAGSTTAELVEGMSVIALGREIALPVSAVMDLSDIERRLVKSPVPMIMGRELFDAGRVFLDIEGGSIAWAPESAATEGAELALTAAHGIETIPVTFGNETTVPADFDLGNGSGLLISADLAQRLRLEPVGVEPAGGIGGATGRLVVYVPELTFAGQTFLNVRAHVSEGMNVPANVGVALLRNFLITTDFPNRRVWLEGRR